MRAATLFATALAFASPAFACSCVIYSPEQAVEENAAIFIGTPSHTVPSDEEGSDAVYTVFTVREVLQGDVAAEQNVAHPENVGGNCGINFEPGNEVLVVATVLNPAGELGTDSCTMQAANEAAIRAALITRKNAAP